MKTIRVALILAVVMFAAAPASAARYAAVVIDADTGAVLHGERSKERRYPASLTKMMTLYLIFERLRSGKYNLSTRMKVPHRATLQPPSRLGLKRGSTITVRDAIRALVVKSANDVATTVAYFVAGNERKFAKVMNRKAQQLGMHRTSFRNASGLWHSKQWTTARDMARLAQALIDHFPQYYDYFSLQSFKFSGRTYRSHNRLLRQYSGADGLKTGYIAKSGFNLALSAVRNGRRLITVVMGGRTARSRDRHVAKLTDRIFVRLKPHPPVNAGAPVWAVQVGAVQDKAAARNLARAAAQKVGLPQGGSWGAWPKTRRRGGTIYQARLVGYGKGEAQRTCRTLKKRRTDCFVIRHGTVFAPPPPPAPKTAAIAQDLPAKASVPRLPPARGETAMGNYAVQVGVYASQKQARNQAQAAADLLRGLPGGINADAWPMKASSGRKLYRAWLTGFEEDEARRACANLKRKKRDCLVLLHRKGPRARA
ncbi:MAG: D-alanyl-D-alanine carboxypeptidase [Alphaproteobacteria bacterium]|nr:D-alanyl-D-alanine carboxypeptidase [Alphaproteobacteria bacterium]